MAMTVNNRCMAYVFVFLPRVSHGAYFMVSSVIYSEVNHNAQYDAIEIWFCHECKTNSVYAYCFVSHFL